MAKVWKQVAVFLGSTREGRVGENVAKFVIRKLKERNLDVVYIDPVEFTLPLLTKPVHFYHNPSEAPKKLVDMHEKIKASDAILVISAEYNHSIPPALSNSLDYFSPGSFSMKPSGIITYSPSLVGGARAGVQLRSILGELGCISVSNMLTISKVGHCIDANGMPLDTDEGKKMDPGFERLMKQVEWWANAAKAHKQGFPTF